MLRRSGLTTEKAMWLFKWYSLGCSDKLAESSYVEEMSIDDPPVALSSGFQNAKNVDNSSDEDLEEQSFSRYGEKKKRNAATVVLIFSQNFGFTALVFDRLRTPTRWCYRSNFIEI
ncbi:hypothetical protein NPIL_202261 [Nephila pilipes]|uniref:Uncharacterized protein n=1 Tax=Nephila pilipes TaxID=299642 RepID=A0A8X6QNS5_NEPPI|nr:hypothetical protein NPIL_202261 [Nephila pilipes]